MTNQAKIFNDTKERERQDEIRKMILYELINPSDPISFYADNDTVAQVSALFVGNGQLLVRRADGEKLNPELPLLMFRPEDEQKAIIREFVGKDFDTYLEENRDALSRSLESYLYGDVRTRATVDKAMSFITDPDKLEEFKVQHEDEQRSSMNQWVKYAWKLAKGFKSKD